MLLSQVMNGIETIGATKGPDGEVRSIHYDSRRCEPGSIFVAISGLREDGHRFIGDALTRGARFIIHERDFEPPPGVTAIRVRDSRQVLGLLGRNFFRHPSSSLCLIAVVGTNGKTTVTYLLEAILVAAGHSAGVLGTVNYRYAGKSFPAPNTTPESFEMHRILREMAHHGVTHCLAEVSSHAIELRRVDECSFDLGIFTNLTQDHLDYHKDMESYFQAKKRFFSDILPRGGKGAPYPAIVNGDDPFGQRIIEELGKSCTTYGLDGSYDARPERFHLSIDGIEAKLNIRGEKIEIKSPMLGRFNLYNILAAAAAARAIGISAPAIEKGIAGLTRVPGRLEKVSKAGHPAVFVDYAHTDDALRGVLQSLSLFRTERIITVFGCGGDRDRGKRPLMGEAATSQSDLSIITSDNPRTEEPMGIIREIEAGIRIRKFNNIREAGESKGNQGYLVIPDRGEAIAAAIGIAEPADIVLIAGKGHEDYQIIGNRRHPFDDRAVAREELRRRL